MVEKPTENILFVTFVLISYVPANFQIKFECLSTEIFLGLGYLTVNLYSSIYCAVHYTASYNQVQCDQVHDWGILINMQCASFVVASFDKLITARFSFGSKYLGDKWDCWNIHTELQASFHFELQLFFSLAWTLEHNVGVLRWLGLNIKVHRLFKKNCWASCGPFSLT